MKIKILLMSACAAASFMLASCSDNEPSGDTGITESTTVEETTAAEKTEPQTEPMTEELPTVKSARFSVDEAVSIVRKYLEEKGDDLTDIHIDYEGLSSFDDKDYYCIRKYSISPFELDGERMGYTLGWFFVDPFEGKLFRDGDNREWCLVPIESSSEP